MASLVWRRWWWVAVVLLLPFPEYVESRNVTHEDIRDAMLSLVHMFRTSEDKLERHEYREKALGDTIKKTLAGLEKKHRALEPLKGMISRLDERLSNVESILLQKEEREKSTQKKTNDALESIQKSLQALTASLPTAAAGGTPSGSLSNRLDSTDAKVDAVKAEIESLKNTLSPDSLRAMCLNIGSDSNPLEKHISEAEKLLNKYELKLSEYNGNASKVQTDFVPLSEVSLADEAWHSKMTEVMERQEAEIKKIQKVLSESESMWKNLPNLGDFSNLTNQTLAAVGQAKESLKEISENSVNKVSGKLRELSDRLSVTNDDIQRSLTQGNTMSERAYAEISRSYEVLMKEVAQCKNDHFLLELADNVIATKKRIEYGVHQILMEVGELVKLQGKQLNKTLNERFDSLESLVEVNEMRTMSNLSSKIETEMSQVWRQIGITYQQLTASKVTLDKLTEQTEQYVNNSASTMDSMKNKVGMITGRMTEVDDNLNYLLGRLSLVSQEFNQVKIGLGETLDKVKSSFLAVKAKVEDGPGPHDIASSEKQT